MAMSADKLIERVEHWRARICPEWSVCITDAPTDDVSEGTDDWIACTNNNLAIAEIVIHYRPSLLTYSKKEIDRIIVHELIHPLLDRVLDHDEVLGPLVGSVKFAMYQNARRGDMEEFVNRMAHCIVNGRSLARTRKMHSHS